MRVRFSDSEQWSSPVKPPRSQNYVKPHNARTRIQLAKVRLSATGFCEVALTPAFEASLCHATSQNPQGAADLPRDLELYAVTSSSQELPSPALPMPSRQPSRNIIVQRVGSGWS
jgi:hypothetical protein